MVAARSLTGALIMKSLTTVLLASLSLAGAAHAGEVHQPFVLTAYSNGAGGSNLLAGKYELALTEIRASKNNMITASTYATNLCVAHTAMRHWNEARVACDAAIKDAERRKPRGFVSPLSDAVDHNTYIAIAYSNRAVVHWLSKEAVPAAEDLAKAHKRAPQADFVVRNILAFKAPHRALPQVAVTE
jgi:hypothetical protein